MTRDRRKKPRANTALRNASPTKRSPRARRSCRAVRLRFHVPPKPMLQPDHALLGDLRRVARRLRTDRLSCRAYELHGLFHSEIFRRRFGSWTEALRRAGLHPASRRLTIEQLHHNMYALWRHFKGKPSVEKVTLRHSAVGWGAYVQRFGSWHRAQLAFTLWIRNPANRRKAYRAWRGSKAERRRAARRISSRPMKRRAASGSPIVTLTMRFRVLRRDRYRCRACGRSPATDPKTVLHVDHIRPVSKGGGLGGRALRNLQTLCKDCNLGKRDTT